MERNRDVPYRYVFRVGMLFFLGGEGRDDVSMPDSIAKKVEKDFGTKVVDAFRSVFSFDPPNSSVN